MFENSVQCHIIGGGQPSREEKAITSWNRIMECYIFNADKFNRLAVKTSGRV